mmetsp:Transcript_8706/g.21100  ORF Transcript_8706/g.21100 Transcript_8706/m.21100 type:complete len:260 (-) Transcript_8706:465-1244(-)
MMSFSGKSRHRIFSTHCTHSFFTRLKYMPRGGSLASAFAFPPPASASPPASPSPFAGTRNTPVSPPGTNFSSVGKKSPSSPPLPASAAVLGGSFFSMVGSSSLSSTATSFSSLASRSRFPGSHKQWVSSLNTHISFFRLASYQRARSTSPPGSSGFVSVNTWGHGCHFPTGSASPDSAYLKSLLQGTHEKGWRIHDGQVYGYWSPPSRHSTCRQRSFRSQLVDLSSVWRSFRTRAFCQQNSFDVSSQVVSNIFPPFLPG